MRLEEKHMGDNYLLYYYEEEKGSFYRRKNTKSTPLF